jgi:hypothetical protein
MKLLSICLAVAGVIPGLLGAWYWYRSSQVTVDPAWRVEPGDLDASQSGWLSALIAASCKSADLNKTAAKWTALSAAVEAVSSVLGNLS